jgi:3-oxoacyl-[acyl-carrier protein] reductase
LGGDRADAGRGQDRHAEAVLDEFGEVLEEFGRTAALVLLPAASYVTGAMIPVDGGAISSI